MPSHFPPDISEDLLKKAVELGVFPEDIDEHFIRGHGPGGQKKNKRSSCVELRHRPTGFFTRVQRYREQHRNRMLAFEILIKKIDQLKEQEKGLIEKEKHKIIQQKHLRRGVSKEKVLRQKRERSSVKKERQQAWNKSLEEW